jgi:hypothetical protein
MPASNRRGIGSIRTMRSLVDARKTRTPATALLELSSLAYEKELLQRELERRQRRHEEITSRLAEIADKEQQLRAIADVGAAPPPAAEEDGSESPTPRRRSHARKQAEPPPEFQVTEWNY